MSDTTSPIKALMSIVPAPDAWSRATSQDVEVARSGLQTQLRRITLLSVLIGVLTFLAGFAATWAHFGCIAGALAACIFLIPVSLTAGTVAFIYLGGVGVRTSLSDLSPLMDSILRLKAWALLSDPAARAYRDRVTAAGRELLVGDYWCMKAEARRRHHERLRQALHGADGPRAAVA